MNKRKVHHIWTKIRSFSQWYFLAGFIFFGLVFVFSYRQNNLTAISLREKVLEVDRQNGDVEAALRELRIHTYKHMNAELDSGDNGIYPPIQLRYRYERLVAAEQQRIAALSGDDLYRKAQDYCEEKFPEGLYGATRIPCMQEYLDSHGGASVKATPIPDDLYKFNFASPRWSPDLAGWSLLMAVVMLFLFVVRIGLGLWLKHTFRSHN